MPFEWLLKLIPAGWRTERRRDFKAVSSELWKLFEESEKKAARNETRVNELIEKIEKLVEELRQSKEREEDYQRMLVKANETIFQLKQEKIFMRQEINRLNRRNP